MTTDLSHEAEQLADALEALLEREGKILMRYVPIGMSCSLGYAVLHGDTVSIGGRFTLTKRKRRAPASLHPAPAGQPV